MALRTCTSRLPAVLACAALLAAPALSHAQAFVGGSIGKTDWRDADCSGFTQCDRKDTGGTFRAGYQYNPWLAVEARYFDLGKVRFSDAGSSVEGDFFSTRSDFSAKGIGIDAVFTWPITPRVALSGMVGIARTEGKASFRSDSPIDSTIVVLDFDSTKRKTNPYYGIGVGFAITPQLALSLEADRYRVDFGGGNVDGDLFAVGLTYRFR